MIFSLLWDGFCDKIFILATSPKQIILPGLCLFSQETSETNYAFGQKLVFLQLKVLFVLFIWFQHKRKNFVKDAVLFVVVTDKYSTVAAFNAINNV